ncbi:MAG: 30S ribosomal protein S8 [Nanoarchaeota archaeon]
MSQDILADAMNGIRNAKRARKDSVKLIRVSKLLVEVLKIMKLKGIIKKYKIDTKGQSVEVSLGEFSECKVIKPRFSVKKDQIEKYRRRYLPARNVGTVVISTGKGLMTHEEAVEKGIGGSLIAYFY